MNGSLRLGAPFGIGLYIHWSFALLILLFLPSAGITGVLFVLALFGCVTLHEYGHALAARRFGIPTHSITLYPIGGVARLAAMPRRPSHELLVAVAGPAVNVAIAAVLAPFALFAGNLDAAIPGSPGGFLGQLLVANVFLVVFNMIPAFPMDGGRVLRSLLAFSGNYAWATHVAARVGQGFAILFALAGVFLFQNPLLVVIAFFIFMAAGAERRAALEGSAPAPAAAAAAVPPPIPTSHLASGGESEWEILPPHPPGDRASGRPPTDAEAVARQLEQLHRALAFGSGTRGRPHWRRE